MAERVLAVVLQRFEHELFPSNPDLAHCLQLGTDPYVVAHPLMTQAGSLVVFPWKKRRA